MTDKMEEIIERARWQFSALVMKGEIPKPSGREVSVFIAKALRDALATPEVIERATRAAAEADGQVWDDLSCKHIYANMVGAAIQAAIGEGT
tara:strand:- start:331 stop:606 length:276 start_codon:yes stop_codon:yes gene_type:complete